MVLLLSLRCCARSRFKRYGGLFKGLLLAMLLLVIIQNISAQIGRRQQFCLVNVLFQRVLPYSEYTAWFINRGMPTESGILLWKGQWASSENFRLFNDPHYETFMNWVLYRGTLTYAFFLISHPGYTFAPLIEKIPVLFSYNLNLWVGLPPDTAPFRLLYTVLPATSLPCSFALAALSLLAAVVWKRPICIVPAALLAGIWFNALFSYHADAMGDVRHCLMNMIGLECLSYMALLLIADIIAGGRYARHRAAANPPGEAMP